MNAVASIETPPASGACQFIVLPEGRALEPLLHRLLATRRWRTVATGARAPSVTLGQALQWIDLRHDTRDRDWMARLGEGDLVCLSPRAGDGGFDVVAVLAPTLAHLPVTESNDAREGDARGDVARTDRLSQREREVLQLLAQGHSNREIGARLHVTLGTVKGYVSQILAKMGVRDRTQAALCIAYGLRQPNRPVSAMPESRATAPARGEPPLHAVWPR